MTKARLSSYSYYVTEKIDINKLNANNYIGVDNLLQNKNGIKISEYLPEEGTAIRFKKGDILLGNIRPYLKKIWLATFDGGCSPDVLCIRCKNFKDSKFIFSVLSDDNFFEYVMKGSKGTKMPRGDKNHIMNYSFIDIEGKDEIGNFIYQINEKILINNKINDNLQQLIQSVYSYWFNQYNFPNSDGLPYADNSGELIYNNVIKREIPKNWMVETFANNSLSKFIDTGISHFESKNYLATANVDNFTIKDGEWVTYSNRESRANMSPSIYSIWFAKMKNSIKHMCIPENGDWMVKKYVFSTGFSGIQCTKNSFAYFYCLINEPFFERTKDILSHGATQQSVNNDDLNSIKIVVPPLNVLKSFAEFANPLYEKICNIIQENQILSEQRDSLLPLLINGQITID